MIKVNLISFIISIVLLLINNDSLNDKIYKCHKSNIGKFSNEIESQFDFRKQYIKDIIELHQQNKNDTILIIEKHDFACDGCPASFVQIFSKEKYIEFRLNMNESKYEDRFESALKEYKSKVPGIETEYLHSDLKIIFENLKKGKKINQIQKENNTNDCYDGSNSIYTLIYPNDELKCMIIRCWK
ncbi:MAG: hypothetical protein LDL23_00685 [Flavobacterium sp.]|uniref:hypothetical protein n=1 Tax=Flavobacterium sp. TaxID=239 RepID=UPI0025BA2837|nr:hypothetical protein [Flavobacterium sp.]MCA1965141.1 hypothetical protein [Flavobacterium sp.]